jgi:predicted MFS family arabinose efflux permease
MTDTVASAGKTSSWWALIMLTAIYICGFIDRIIMQVLVEPVKAEFSLSDLQIGIVAGLAFAVLNVLLGLWVARFAERCRRMSLVAVGTVLWSIATSACGMAGTFIQLLLARISVGVGEAVGLPSSSSIISDYFPKKQRTTAMSILMLSPPIGAFIGFVGGGYVAQAYGWRAAFWIAAIPGFILAIAAAITVGEPQRGRYDDLGEKADEVPPFRAVLKRAWHRHSLRHLLIGSTAAALVGFGLNAFLTSFLIRRFGFTIAQAGLIAGIIASLPAVISMTASGWLADWIGARDSRAYGYIPGISLLIAAPAYILAVTRADATSAVVLLGIATLFQYTYLGPTLGVFQNMMHPRMRATSSAFNNMLYTLIGNGLGPVLVGVLSDRFGPADPASSKPGEGLMLAMAVASVGYLWAAIHYLLATRTLRGELVMSIEESALRRI